MRISRRWLRGFLVVAVLLLAGAAFVGYRALRLYNVASDMESQVRYLIENGGTIGEVPAEQAFSATFLEAIFGDNPELLDKLKGVVNRGLADDPSLNLGEVAAMMVSYHLQDDGSVTDVVVHAVGGFPLTREKPGLHRNGYFFQQLDRGIWSYGNLLIGFLGRDMVLFSGSDATTERQQELFDSLFSGDINLLVERLQRPLYYTIVFPDPKRIVPPQLRTHIQAVIVKGSIGYYEGYWEVLALTPSPRAAGYTLSVMSDMKLAAELALKTRWGGVKRETLWGPVIDPWWAYEIVQTLQATTMEKQDNLVTAQTEYGRIMVNVVLKMTERMGRDLAMMRAVQGEKMDPRQADAMLRTSKPMHYWSEPHQWGPDWPIPPRGTTNAFSSVETEEPVSAPQADSPTAPATASDADGAVEL